MDEQLAERVTRSDLRDEVKAAKGPSELEICMDMLSQQRQLLNKLEGRLRTVSHASPLNEEKEGDRVPHIASVRQEIGENCKRIANIIDALAV